MCYYIFQSFCFRLQRYRLATLIPIQCRHISIAIPGEKDLRSSGLLSNRRDDALQGGGAVPHKVAAHHLPVAPSRHQLGSGDDWFFLLVVPH